LVPLVPLAQRQAQAAMVITRRWIYRQAKPTLEKLFSLPTAEVAVVQGQQATTAQAVEVAELEVLGQTVEHHTHPRLVEIPPYKARLLETGLVAEVPLVEPPMLTPVRVLMQNMAAVAEAVEMIPIMINTAVHLCTVQAAAVVDWKELE